MLLIGFSLWVVVWVWITNDRNIYMFFACFNDCFLIVFDGIFGGWVWGFFLGFVFFFFFRGGGNVGVCAMIATVFSY